MPRHPPPRPGPSSAAPAECGAERPAPSAATVPPGTDLGADFDLPAAVFDARVAEHVERRRQRLGLSLTDFDPRAAATRLAIDDLRLATAADLGSAVAWAKLDARERPRLLRLLTRHCDPGEAEAICSDVLANLCLPPPRPGARTLLGTYDGSGPLFAWLGTIALRRLFRVGRRRAAERSDGPQPPPIVVDAAERLEEQGFARRFEGLWPAAWARLERAERAAVLFKHREGLSQRVAARLMGVSEPTVSRLLRRGLVKLQGAIVEALRGEAGEPTTREGWALLEAALSRRLEMDGPVNALGKEA